MHHSSEFSKEFANFNKSGYERLETIQDVDPDYWGYFKILGKLKELGYPIVDKLWCYNEMNVNDIVMLKYNNETKRMKTIAVMTETCHSYITHPLTQPNIIEEPILSL